MKNPKLHYHLASTRVVFSTPDGTPGVSEHNVVLDQESKDISTRGLSKIQEIAQLSFRRKVTADPSYEVQDVFIVGISYLGHMTKEEFYPKEQQQAEKAAAAPMSPLLNPGKSTQHGEIDHVLTSKPG